MSAVLANQELDSIIEGMQALLGDGGLCLLDDIQGVRGAQAQCIYVAQWLQAAVWVHAVHQAICRRVRNILEQWKHGVLQTAECKNSPMHTVEMQIFICIRHEEGIFS